MYSRLSKDMTGYFCGSWQTIENITNFKCQEDAFVAAFAMHSHAKCTEKLQWLEI